MLIPSSARWTVGTRAAAPRRKEAVVIEQPRIATRKGAPDMFTGDVFIDTVVQSVEGSLVRVNAVHFTPGARTAWHSHALGQYLHVVEGVGLVQERGDEIRALRPGDTVFTAPGVWHWHGASPDHLMTHLAVWQAPESGSESEWGDHVSDDEYARQPRDASR
jgi:quercetin dioxygenase-like cupin family protein